MTEKRFIEFHKDCRVIKNTQTCETATYYDTEDGLMFLKWLNNLSDENEKLKKQLESEHQQLENAILLERTRMGQSALKQYKEAIQ